MKLALQILLLALCLTALVNAAIKKASYQDVKKILTNEKSQPPIEEARSRKTTAHAMPYNMPYVNTLHFRQSTSERPVPEGGLRDPELPVFDLREEASGNLRAIPSTEVDRHTRFTTSIVFGLGGSDGYGF